MIGKTLNRRGDGPIKSLDAGKYAYVDISSDGAIVAIGSYSDGIISVHSYDSTSNQWTQRGNNITFDPFVEPGFSMSMSADGNRVAFSTNSVSVYTYDENSNDWTPCGDTPIGSPVILSSMGNKLTIGNDSTNTAQMYETGNKVSNHHVPSDVKVQTI